VVGPLGIATTNDSNPSGAKPSLRLDRATNRLCLHRWPSSERLISCRLAAQTNHYRQGLTPMGLHAMNYPPLTLYSRPAWCQQVRLPCLPLQRGGFSPSALFSMVRSVRI
jgi:hypothetical protein